MTCSWFYARMTNSNTTSETQPGVTLDELKAATDLLKKVAGNRALLAGLTSEERKELVLAAGEVYNPDMIERRRLVRATERRRKEQLISRDQAKLSSTGIREMRKKPVYMTPNALAPANFEQQDVADPEFREVLDPQNCYICKQDYTLIHHFYDHLCPTCADLNFAKRTESADLKGRVALLTGGRVKIG